MNAKMKNLFNGEEIVILNLKNMHYQVSIYLDELKKLRSLEHSATEEVEFERFDKIFKYYKKKLIPALQESAEMEARHIKVLKKNPDPDFKPLRQEVEFHQQLMTRFTLRFEEVHSEFHRFTVNFKKNQIK